MKTAVAHTTGSIAAASWAAAPIMAILASMKMTPETRVATKVPAAGVTLAAAPRMPRRAKPAITRAAAPSAAKSMKGEVVVSWMTAAETSPMPRAWRAVGRMMRIARQKAEMMNSGLIMPADTAEIALPTVKFKMKPAASRMPSRMSERTSSPSQGAAVTTRADSSLVMGLPLWACGCAGCGAGVRVGGAGAGGRARRRPPRGLCKQKGPRSNRRPGMRVDGYGAIGLTVDRPGSDRATTSC